MLFRSGDANGAGDDGHREDNWLYLQIPRGGGRLGHGGRGTQGSTGVGQEAEGEGEPAGKSLYCGFCEKEQARQGKQVSDRLV